MELQNISLEIEKLNPPQKEAVRHTEGPVVIYAGAGSGKTRVICNRIAQLIVNGVAPSSILAVTFTNKAAREMKERIEQIIGHRAHSIIISTFHSACARFLRIYAKEIGFGEAFSIYDDDDQKNLLKDVLKDINISDKILNLATLKSRIDKLKNKGKTPESYNEELKRDDFDFNADSGNSFRRFGEEVSPEIIQKCYALYQSRLKQQNAMDFNDLLLLMVELLEKSKLAKEQMQNRFRYFMVDEFQDTNPIQFKFIQLLCDHTRNICIVGDDDQSIYSWRGAEPAFILEFNQYFPDAVTYKLEQNYRSSNTIVNAATSVISHNLKRSKKTLWTNSDPGDKIVIKTANDSFEEGQFICGSILKDVENGAQFSEFAVLYRTNAQSRAIEDELRRRMLPYIIYGSVRFYERAEVKVLLAYLRLLVNPDDDAAFQKMISVPRRGFGDKAMVGLKKAAQENGNISLMRAAHRYARNEISAEIGRGAGALKEVSQIFSALKTELDAWGLPSRALVLLLSHCRFEEYLRTAYPEDSEDRWLNVMELKNALIEFESNAEAGTNILAQFIEQAALTVEPTVHNVQTGQAAAISLMTIHASKGLEFDRVFIAGLEEGVLPHMNSLESEASVEEERRLLYVAMTRARHKLSLTHILRNRFRSDMFAEPSRFLSEIPQELTQSVDKKFSRNPYQSKSQSQFSDPFSNPFSDSSDFAQTPKKIPAFGLVPAPQPAFDPLADPVYSDDSAEEQNWHKGTQVKHKTFGVGVVQNVEKSLGGFRLEIRFPIVGVKKIMHTFVTPL